MKKLFSPLLLSLLFLFLLLFPAQSFAASKNGLLLWFDTLLPTLLPFLIISQLILKTPLINVLKSYLGPVFQKIFHCSDSGAFCLLCGLLCGYPVGARLIVLELEDGNLSLSEAQYLLSFCNNVSPMFCISYGISYAMNAEQVLPYLLIIYGSALLFGIITRPQKRISTFNTTKKQTSSTENIFQLIDVCIIDSFLILVKLCGYLILFSILSKGIEMLLPKEAFVTSAFLTSVLEITNGLSLIAALPHGLLRTTFAIGALSFGGLCCILQTNSVISNTSLSLTSYICKKLLITLLTLLLFFSYSFFSSWFAINCWS